MADKDIKNEPVTVEPKVEPVTVEPKVEPVKEVKLHKVKFISTLFSFDFKHFAGDVVELNDEVYQIAKKYNSIEDV